MFLSGLVGLGGLLYLASAATAQPPMGMAPGGAPAPAPTGAARPTVAVFNMAAVMRDFEKAKLQVWNLNKMRIDSSANLVALRGQMVKLNEVIRNTPDPSTKAKLEKDMLDLQHKFQIEERDVNKKLNDEASKIIAKLYDEIKMVVDKTAEMNAYHLVLAYPDAVTAEEQANPYLKELKLKPPAAQPFYVSKQVDITPVVLQTLNAWYPPLNEQGQKVDVSKLPVLQDPTAPGAATPTQGGTPPVTPSLPMGAVPTPGK
jgi:Skp family chaperone for outer membrane proteins